MRADSVGVNYLETKDLGQELVPVINALQSATSLLFSERERKTYTWVNEAERLNQLGMTEGSEGYQLDTKAEYKYENGKWRYSTPHAEYGVTRNLGDGGIENVGASPAISAGYSSSTTFVQALPFSIFRIIDPGIYSLSMVTKMSAPSTGSTELLILRANANGSYGEITATGLISPERSYGSVSLPNIRLITANNDFAFAISKRTNGDADVTSTIRITRIG